MRMRSSCPPVCLPACYLSRLSRLGNICWPDLHSDIENQKPEKAGVPIHYTTLRRRLSIYRGTSLAETGYFALNPFVDPCNKRMKEASHLAAGRQNKRKQNSQPSREPLTRSGVG